MVRREFHCPSISTNRALMIPGTLAGAFGHYLTPQPIPLHGTVEGDIEVSFTTTPSGEDENGGSPGAPLFFYVTDPLPCARHTLTLNVDNPEQEMHIDSFSFAPCLTDVTASSPTSSKSSGTAIGSVSAPPSGTSVPGHPHSHVGVAVGIAASVLLLACLPGLAFWLHRRHRHRRSVALTQRGSDKSLASIEEQPLSPVLDLTRPSNSMRTSSIEGRHSQSGFSQSPTSFPSPVVHYVPEKKPGPKPKKIKR
ncbi:hypothetical protein BC834DRAFT_142927 [Gloeopeniophorella convolvens]|nr:hypothetical protein BC834DRAFT_142927 [Gloeopeniophorella convolvens]